MKNLRLLIFIMISIMSNAQVGVNTETPGSTLEVNGSFAANLKYVTSATYTLEYTDYYVGYEGTTDAIFTLPTGASGTCKCEGRAYEIFNNSTKIVTVNTVAGETYSNGSSTITLNPNTSIKAINANKASGKTWDIVFYAQTLPSKGTFIPYVTFAGKYDAPNPVQSWEKISSNDGRFVEMPMLSISVNDGNYSQGTTWVSNNSTNYYQFPTNGYYQVTGFVTYGFYNPNNTTNYGFAMQPSFRLIDPNNSVNNRDVQIASIGNLSYNYGTQPPYNNWYSSSSSVTTYFLAGQRVFIGSQLCAGCTYTSGLYYQIKAVNFTVLKLSEN